MVEPNRTAPAMAELLTGRTIVVAEDCPDILVITTFLLEMNGYKVIPVENGLEAFKVLSTLSVQPFALLTDWSMPHLSGGELIRKIAEAQLDLNHIIVFSSLPQNELSLQDLRTLRPNFSIQFLEKPFGVEDLLKVLKKPTHADHF